MSDRQPLHELLLTLYFNPEVMKSVFTIFIFSITVQLCQAQSVGDYRSALGTGFSTSWQNIASWETYNGSSWVAAGSTPDFSNGRITIRDTIQNFAAITLDEVEIEDGAFIRSYGTITLNSGANDEVIVKAGGEFLAFAEVRGTDSSSDIRVDSAGIMTTNGGKIDSFVNVDISKGGLMRWTGGSSFTNEGTINNHGTLSWENEQGLTATNKIGVVNNYARFIINSKFYTANPFETHFFNEQVLNNYGTITIDSGNATIGFADLGFNSIRYAHFNNHGLIHIKQGSLNITEET